MAVVSYIGADAARLMPLKRGDVLVCEASRQAIRAGITDPEALRRFVRRGVKVHSSDGLHAKFVVGSRSAWIGSANASGSSRDRMIEASAKISDLDAVRELRQWGENLATQSPRLGLADVERLVTMKPKQRFGWPTRERVAELPDTVERLRVVGLVGGMSREAEEIAQEEAATIAERLVVPESRLHYFEWFREVRSDVVIRDEDWVIRVGTRGKPSVPQRVEYRSTVTMPGNGYLSHHVVWTLPAKVSRRPSRAELGNAVGQPINNDTDLLVTGSRVRRVLDLYR